MKTPEPAVPQSDNVSHEADDVGQQSTGEGAGSAMAVLRERREADRLLERAESNADGAVSPG